MRKHFSWLIFGSLTLIAGFVVSCGSESSSGTVTISGTLAVSAARDARGVESRATYTVRCVTLSGTPTAGEGAVDTTTGAFSLDLATATNVPIGCFVLDSTTSAVVAVVSFESTTTGIDGSATREGSYVAGDGTSGLEFGTVTVNLSTGTATVKKDKIVASGSTSSTVSGTWTDPTGTWKIGAIPGEPPTGYAKVCPAGQTEGCNGPSEGEPVYFKQYTAKDETGKEHYGLALYKSADVATACGGEGVTLPAGWTAVTAGLTTAPAIVTTFADPATVNNKGNICDNMNTNACNTLNSGWSLTAAQCRFYCAVMATRDASTGCRGDLMIDWENFPKVGNLGAQTPSYAGSWSGIGSANTSDPNVVSWINNTLRFDKKRPRGRHMMNEVIITGNIGSLQDNQTETRHACGTFGAQGQCTVPMVPCTIQRTMRITMTQASATSAVAELVQRSALAPNQDAACSTDTKLTADLAEMKVLFTLTKQ